MAQVNIASLGELWAGTLSWTLDTSQTVYAASSKSSLSPGSSSYPWTGSSPYTSTQSVTVPSTGSNRYIFLFYYARHAQRNSTLNSNFTVTLNGVTLSQLGGAASYWSWDGGTGAVYYGPAPTTGAQNVVTSHTNARGTRTSYNFECDYFFMLMFIKQFHLNFSLSQIPMMVLHYILLDIFNHGIIIITVRGKVFRKVLQEIRVM